MKFFPLIGAVALLLCTGAAFAEEGARKPHDWSGFYVGGSLSLPLALGTDSAGADDPSQTIFDLPGAQPGVWAGYNQQVGKLVLGVEGSFQLKGLNGS